MLADRLVVGVDEVAVLPPAAGQVHLDDPVKIEAAQERARVPARAQAPAVQVGQVEQDAAVGLLGDEVHELRLVQVAAGVQQAGDVLQQHDRAGGRLERADPAGDPGRGRPVPERGHEGAEGDARQPAEGQVIREPRRAGRAGDLGHPGGIPVGRAVRRGDRQLEAVRNAGKGAGQRGQPRRPPAVQRHEMITDDFKPVNAVGGGENLIMQGGPVAQARTKNRELSLGK